MTDKVVFIQCRGFRDNRGGAARWDAIPIRIVLRQPPGFDRIFARAEVCKYSAGHDGEKCSAAYWQQQKDTHPSVRCPYHLDLRVGEAVDLPSELKGVLSELAEVS